MPFGNWFLGNVFQDLSVSLKSIFRKCPFGTLIPGFGNELLSLLHSQKTCLRSKLKVLFFLSSLAVLSVQNFDHKVLLDT